MPARGAVTFQSVIDNGTLDRLARAELVPELVLERQAVAVAPLALDDERVALARLERPAHLLVWQDAALDAPGIEEDGVAGSIVVPEIRVERQERVHDFLAAIVEQLDVVIAAPPVHRRREVQVHAQLVRRHDVPARVDMRHDRRGRSRDGRPADDGGNLLLPPRRSGVNRREPRGIEDDVVLPAFVERKHRREAKRALGDRVSCRRQRAPRSLAAALPLHRHPQQRLPFGFRSTRHLPSG